MRAVLRLLFSAWRQWWSRYVARGIFSAHKVNYRADRFVMQWPLVYRRNGGLVWYDGNIENVSTSGLLFHGEKPLSPGEVLQVSFWLPGVHGVDKPTQVFCWAKVVRIRLPNSFEPNHTHAVRILRYRSQPQPPADIRKLIGEVRGPISKIRKRLPGQSDGGEEKRAT